MRNYSSPRIIPLSILRRWPLQKRRPRRVGGESQTRPYRNSHPLTIRVAPAVFGLAVPSPVYFAGM